MVTMSDKKYKELLEKEKKYDESKKAELIKIATELKEWCDKHEKDFVAVHIHNGTIVAHVDTKDLENSELDIYIKKEGD